MVGQGLQFSKVPCIEQVVKATLSIFHGPLVEASFNLMGDIIDPKSSNTAIPTYAFQTVEYTLKSSNMSATQIFKRDDPKYGYLDKRLCQNIESAGARDAARRQKNRISAMERAKEYGYEKAQTAEDSKRAILKAEMRAKMKHAAKHRRRALEILVAKKLSNSVKMTMKMLFCLLDGSVALPMGCMFTIK